MMKMMKMILPITIMLASFTTFSATPVQKHQTQCPKGMKQCATSHNVKKTTPPSSSKKSLSSQKKVVKSNKNNKPSNDYLQLEKELRQEQAQKKY